ncbi:MAG: hypothetical protein FJ290_26190 [Planctomycetes bacterium]|nr:hypothetical protein [Planctomycetota bacterium]
MNGHRIGVVALLAAGSLASGEMVTRRWTPLAGEGERTLRFDLAGLPSGARVYRADLVLARSGPVLGNEDDAMVKVEVCPASGGKPLALRGPWFDRLDASEAIRAACRVPRAQAQFVVKSCPKWAAESTYLDVAYEGQAEKPPPAAKGLKALHRSGLTFITWQELEDPFGAKTPTLDELRAALKQLDATKQVRCRIYRHTERIDAKSIAQAELLAEVAPLSGYNARGVSTDHVIHQRQLRAIDDGLYARSIAADPFKVSPDAPEMGALPVRRLAIEDGKPLPPGLGLYVHQPGKAGRAFYAVATCVDGVTNLRDLATGSSLAEPVAEEAGPGEPVFQNVEDLKVFYDYPGQRMHYVQWCAPPLANLPNQHHNWSVFVPTAATGKEPLALGIYFQDWRGFYLRPRWPHKRDQILIATDDSPWPSFGYGYHEALGTPRSFAEGVVHDYTAARIDAFVAWVRKKFAIDPARISCHGMGTLGGTAAVHYAFRHGGSVAWVVAGYFDPSPGTCPATIKSGERELKTHLPQMEAVWGKREWDIKTAAGASIWKDRDLTAWVRANPKAALPFFSIGAGTLSPVWAQQVPFMKALLETRQPFIAEFDWGGSPPRYGPEYVRLDKPMPAVNPDRMEFASRDYWAEAKVHYSSGGSINSGLSWDPQAIADAPDRLEIEGRFGGAVTLRNAQHFRLKPGERAAWVLDTGRRETRRAGEATADEHGLVTIPGLAHGKLILTRADARNP